MAGDAVSIELAEITDLAALVDEVRRSRRPRILRRGGEDVAVLAPAELSRKRRPAVRRLRPPTAEEVDRSLAGIEAAAGAWGDVDTDALKQELRRQRDIISRPPLDQ